jgi:hypothetical protein
VTHAVYLWRLNKNICYGFAQRTNFDSALIFAGSYGAIASRTN